MSVPAKKPVDSIGVFLGLLLAFIVFWLAVYPANNDDFDFHNNLAASISLLDLNKTLFQNPLSIYMGYHVATKAVSFFTMQNFLYAGALVLALGALISYACLRKFLVINFQTLPAIRLNLFAFSLMLVCPLYLPWFSPHVYLGQISATTWHNPTNALVKPFALFCAVLFILLYKILQQEGKIITKTSIVLAIVGVVSTFIKPSFAQIYIPASAMFLFIEWALKRVSLKKALWFYVVTVVPAGCIMAFQAVYIFFLGAFQSSRSLAIGWYNFYSIYSPNVLVSLLVSVAFPLAVYIFFFKEAMKDAFFRFSGLCFLVGYAEAVLLYDKNSLESGDFSWGALLGIFLLFVGGVKVLLTQSATQETASRFKRAGFIICFGLFVMHTLCGVYFAFFAENL